MARDKVVGTSVSIAELEALGVKVSAARLSSIDELRIYIALPNGGKVVILRSESGNPQDAGVFSGVDGELEVIGVQSGSMQMWTPDAEGKPEATEYLAGEVAFIDPTKPHATHPAKDAWIVAFMTDNWFGARKSGDPAFDAAVDAQLAVG